MADEYEYDGYGDPDQNVAEPEDAVDENSLDDGSTIEPTIEATGFAPSGLKGKAELAAQSYISNLKSAQKTNSEIMQQAQQVLLQRANEPMDAAGWFKIAAALGKPTRTGSFGESLSNVNEVLGGEADKKLKAKRDLEEMQMKYKMQLGSQAAEMSKAELDAYIKTAGIKSPPPSKVRQMQIELQGMDPNSAEAKQIQEQINRLNAPRGTAANRPETEKQWALKTLREYNANPETANLKDVELAQGILGKAAGQETEKQWALKTLRDFNANPKNPEINVKDVELAETILGANKPTPFDRSQVWSGDEANASLELFGTIDASGQNEKQRKQVRDRATQVRGIEAAQNRAPKEPKEPKEKAVDITEFPIIAQQLGVPFVNSPYKNVNDKTAQALLGINTKEAQKKMEALNAIAGKSQNVDQEIDQFLAANKKAPTGRERSWLPSFGKDYQLMEASTAKLAPENRIANTGTVSDFDAKQLLKGTLSITNTYETNRTIGQAIKISNQMARDKAQFMADFFEANRHMGGAEKEWMRYAQANPILDPRKEGQYVLNPNRKTYKQFFYPEERRANGGMVGYANGGVVSTVNNYQGYGDLASLRQKYAQGGAVRMEDGGTPPNMMRLPPMAPSSDAANRARAFFGQGLGMSTGDEAEALYRSYLTDDGRNRSYDNILNEIRKDYRRYSEENPLEALVYEFSGGLAPAIGSMLIPGAEAGAIPELGRLGQLTAKYAPRVSAASRTKVGRMSAAGGGQGAISGFGAGEGGVENRLGEAVESGLTGAIAAPVVGTTLGLVGKGGRKLYQGGKRMFNQPLPIDINVNPYEDAAFAKILEKMRQDEITPRQAVGRVASERGYLPTPNKTGVSPESRLRDVSPGLTDLAETVTQRPGAGRTNMTRDVSQSGGSSKGRVGRMIEENVAKGKNLFQTEMDLTDDLRSNAKNLYDNAYSFGTVKDPRILAMLDQPAFKDAYRQVMETNKIRKANAIAKGKDPSEFDMKEIYRVKPGQNPSNPVIDLELVAAPDVKTLDQIKRGLDYKIRTGRKSANAADQDAAHALNEYKNTFLGVLDENVPAYKDARQTYKGDLEVLDALDFGRSQYGKMAPEAAQDYVSKLSPTEKDALRIGYAQQFRDKIGNSKNAINAAQEVLGADYNVERMKLLFDSPKEFDLFKKLMQVESRNVRNAQQVMSGSATGRRAEMQKEFEGDSWAQSALDLAGGSYVNTFFRILRNAPNLFKNEKVAESVSKILNISKPSELNKVLKQLELKSTEFAKESRKLERDRMAGARATGKMSGETPIAADAQEEPMVIPSAVEGGNADYSPISVQVMDEEPAEGQEPREYEDGGYVIEDPNSLKSILDRTQFSGYGEAGGNRQNSNQFFSGRVGYTQPVGEGAVTGGLSGMSMKYKGETPEGRKYSGGKDALTGVDLGYGDAKQRLMMKYARPGNQGRMQPSEVEYARNLDQNRGTVGVRHSRFAPTGEPDKRTELFYNREFNHGGAVNRK